jgi:DNA-binding transcriptional ArsR family regulator
MPAPAAAIDGVFRALSDETRRRVLERLGKGPASVSELAAPFGMALPSFVQHLRVLEEGGLVRSRKEGRVRTYQLAPKRLQLAEHWLARQRSLWERRLDQLDSYLLALHAEEAKAGKTVTNEENEQNQEKQEENDE